MATALYILSGGIVAARTAAPSLISDDFAEEMESAEEVETSSQSDQDFEEAAEMETLSFFSQADAAELDIAVSYFVGQENRLVGSVTFDEEEGEEFQRVQRTINTQLRLPVKQGWRNYFTATKALYRFKLTGDLILSLVVKVADKGVVREREAQLAAEFSHLSVNKIDHQHLDSPLVSSANEEAFHTPGYSNVYTTVKGDWEAERQKLKAKLEAKMKECIASTVEDLACRREGVADELFSIWKETEKLQMQLQTAIKEILNRVDFLLKEISEDIPGGSSTGVDKLVRGLAGFRRKAAGILKKLGTRKMQCPKEKKLNNDALTEQTRFLKFASSLTAEINTVWEEMGGAFESNNSPMAEEAELHSGSTAGVSDIDSGGQPEVDPRPSKFMIPDHLPSPPAWP